MNVKDPWTAQLLDLYEHAPCGFHSLDPNGVFLHINDTELNWLGYSREEVIGRKRWVDFLTPEGCQVFDENFSRLKAEGVVRDLEFEVARKDGSRFPVLVSATAVRNSDGEFVMSRSIVYDLSFRKRAGDVFHPILEAVPDAILICNNRGEIVLTNAQVKKLLGYSPHELQGQSIESLIPRDLRPKHVREREKFLLHPQARTMGSGLELRALRADGTVIPVEVSLSPIQVNGGFWVVSTLRDITERRLADDELRKSEARYRSVVDVMAEGVVVQESNGTITACNRSAERILGLTESQMMGLTSVDPRWRSIHEDGSPFPGEVHPSMVALHTGKRQSNVCMGVHKPDGSITWILINAEPVFYPDTDIPRAVVTTFTDISDRKNIEEALRTNEERFRVALKSSPTVVFNQDLQLRYTWINDPVLAWAEKGWLGKTDSDILDPDSARRLTTLKNSVLQSGTGRREEVCLNLNGRSVHYDLTVDPLRDPTGNIAGITCAATDITPLKEAQQSILEREAEISALFDASPVGLALFGPELRYLRVNEKLAEINGLPAKDHIGKTVAETIPILAPTIEPALLKVFSEQQPVLNVEMSAPPADLRAGLRHRLSSYFPIKNSRGVTIMAGAFVLDVTEQKQLEERLLQAQKLEAVGRLAGGIAHDFNNVLGVILGHCDLLKEECSTNDAVIRRAKSIRTAADHAVALTRQLLAFSRKQVMQPQPLNLNELVRRLSEMLRRLLTENIHLTLDLSADTGLIYADKVQVEQVLMNLAVNARDAMISGGRLTIATSNVAIDREYPATDPPVKPGQYVMISVSDTGSGMDAKTKERVFEPFFTTKELGRGTGLGLSIIYGIVRQSGGHIRVYSEPGRGSTFKVYLPRYCGTAAPQTESATAGRAKATGGTETILVVEDDDAVREMLVGMLEPRGYSVLSASSAEEALTLLESYASRIPLLLTDVVLKGDIDGPGLARKTRVTRPEMKVLFMTGYSEAFISASSDEFKDVKLIEKPFSSEDLHRKLGELLDESR